MSEQPKEHGTGRYAKKHGARALSDYIAAGKIDGRTWIGKALRDLRLELAADAGGLDHLTARERMLIDRCAAAALICSTIEGHVFTSDRLVDDAGELLPILRKGYVTHVQSLSRMLQALGLSPARADRTGTLCAACGDRFADLQQYLAHKQSCPPAAPAARSDSDATSHRSAAPAPVGQQAPAAPQQSAPHLSEDDR